MTTITKERLRERAREKVKSLAFSITQTAFADLRAELEEELELARIALASLTAAPVVPDELAKAFISAIEKEQDRLFGEDYLMDSKDCIDVIREEAQRLNACGAAVLHAGIDSTNGKALTNGETVANTPVAPDGWIKCSDRMPMDGQEVLTMSRMGNRFVSFFDEHSGLFFDRADASAACCIEHILVTHWMPLPAAPQQEVRSKFQEEMKMGSRLTKHRFQV